MTAPKTDAAQAPKSTTEKRPPLMARVKGIVRKHGVLALACSTSLATGMCITWFWPAGEEEAEVSNAPKITYVAASTRRNEPISPIVPFEGLDKDVVALGKRLFHDRALSGNGRVSCSSCHNIEEGGDDGLAFSKGVNDKQTLVNAPTVLNAALNFAQNWTGRVRTLEEQVDDPLLAENQMHSDWERITKYLNTDPTYARAFRTHLHAAPSPELVRKAIATYERSLVTVDAKFDQWLAGKEKALSTEELSGYYSFQKYNCVNCHQGPGVGGTMFQSVANMEDYFSSKRKLGSQDFGRFEVTGKEADRWVFRVPSLRNVELTGPYFHDGSAKTLEMAIETMIREQAGEEPNVEEVRRIGLFLKSLTGVLPK